MEGAQLQNIKGIGDKLSQKIIDELGGEDELNQVIENLDLERLINIDGISQRKARNLLPRKRILPHPKNRKSLCNNLSKRKRTKQSASIAARKKLAAAVISQQLPPTRRKTGSMSRNRTSLTRQRKPGKLPRLLKKPANLWSSAPRAHRRSITALGPAALPCVPPRWKGRYPILLP